MAACFRAGEDDQALTLFDHMRSSSAPVAHNTRDTRALLTVTLGTPDALPEGGGFPSNEAGVGKGLGAGGRVLGSEAGVGRAVEAGGVLVNKAGVGRGSEAVGGVPVNQAGVRRELGMGAKEGLGAPPPVPDTASYNTVIAAVASARGVDGRDDAMALVDEMRVRGRG